MKSILKSILLGFGALLIIACIKTNNIINESIPFEVDVMWYDVGQCTDAFVQNLPPVNIQEERAKELICICITNKTNSLTYIPVSLMGLKFYGPDVVQTFKKDTNGDYHLVNSALINSGKPDFWDSLATDEKKVYISNIGHISRNKTIDKIRFEFHYSKNLNPMDAHSHSVEFKLEDERFIKLE